MVTHHIWDAIATFKELADVSGVRMKGADFFFPSCVEEDEVQMSKMLEIISSDVRGFRHDAQIIGERGIGEKDGAVDAYELLHLLSILTELCSG
jgi:D-amino-acid oxidase